MSVEPERETPPPYIRYSSGVAGQAVQRRSPPLAYQAVLDLLNSCTDWSGEWTGGELSLFKAGSFVQTPYNVDAMIAEFSALLGEHRSTFCIAGFGGENEQRTVEWSYDGTHHVSLVQRLFAEPRDHARGIFALRMRCELNARLRDPRSGASLAGDGYDPHTLLPPSYFGIEISPAGVRLDLGLVFPFPTPSEAFLDALRAVRPYLPVRLGKASFTHVQPLSAQKERRHKLSVGLFDGI